MKNLSKEIWISARVWTGFRVESVACGRGTLSLIWWRYPCLWHGGSWCHAGFPDSDEPNVSAHLPNESVPALSKTLIHRINSSFYFIKIIMLQIKKQKREIVVKRRVHQCKYGLVPFQMNKFLKTTKKNESKFLKISLNLDRIVKHYCNKFEIWNKNTK